jgi:hypothetical protein
VSVASEVARILSDRFVELARARATSRAIKNNLFVVMDEELATAHVVAGPYWARYYHDGRGIVLPTEARVLVWFKDSRQDPRRNDSPTFVGRRLTKEEFKNAKDAGLLVIARRSGPSRPNPFFTLAAGDLEAELPALSPAIDTAVLQGLRDAGVPGVESPIATDPAVFRLGF